MLYATVEASSAALIQYGRAFEGYNSLAAYANVAIERLALPESLQLRN